MIFRLSRFLYRWTFRSKTFIYKKTRFPRVQNPFAMFLSHTTTHLFYQLRCGYVCHFIMASLALDLLTGCLIIHFGVPFDDVDLQAYGHFLEFSNYFGSCLYWILYLYSQSSNSWKKGKQMLFFIINQVYISVNFDLTMYHDFVSCEEKPKEEPISVRRFQPFFFNNCRQMSAKAATRISIMMSIRGYPNCVDSHSFWIFLLSSFT